MEKFQVFNKESQQWEDYNIISGWSENFVTDKTTDSAKIKVFLQGAEKPNIDINSWCRIIHGDAPQTKGITVLNTKKYLSPNVFSWYWFKEDNKTYIHFEVETQNCDFVASEIDNVQVAYKYNDTEFVKTLNKDVLQYNAYWEWQISNITAFEIEPHIIKVPKPYTYGIETKQIAKNYDEFVVKAYSIDIDKVNEQVNIQLELAEPIEITKGIVFETRPFTNQIGKKIDGIEFSHEELTHFSVLEKLLQTTPTNNCIFDENGATKESWFGRIKIDLDFYNILKKRFNDETFNENTLYEILLDKFDSYLGVTPVLFFDNFVDVPTYILSYEKEKTEIIELNDLKENSSQELYTKSIDNFADGIVSNYDNLTTEYDIKTPEKRWVVPEVDTDNRNLTSYNKQDGSWILKLPHKIKIVQDIKCLQFSQSGVNIVKTEKNYKILEKKQYLADNYANDHKTEYIWYEDGLNIIHLNDVYYSGYNWVFQVTYVPYISGRIGGEEDYNAIVNQTSSNIDNLKYSDYLKDYIASMDKEDLTISRTYDNFDDIKEVGTKVNDNGRTYVITNVSVQNRGFEYDAVYQLNENHTRRNNSIVAPTEARKNMAIAVDANKERKTIFIDKFKISMTEFQKQNKFNIDKEALFSSILNFEKLYPQFALFKFKSTLWENIASNNTHFVDARQFEKELLCEIARFVLKDTICFNMRYFDNAEAGKRKESSGLFLPDKQIPILYTDGFGEFDKFDFKLIQSTNTDLKDIPTSMSITTYTQNVAPIIKGFNDYPLPTDLTIERELGSIDGINYFKDMLDTFNFTLGIGFDADKNIILCRQFFLDNRLLTTEDVVWVLANFYIATFDKNITEEEATNYSGLQNMNTIKPAFEDNKIKFTTSIRPTKKSLCIYNHKRKPLIIINDFNDFVQTDYFSNFYLYI